MNKLNLIGTAFDWEGFDKAKQERWSWINPHLFHCSLHDTHFDPFGYDENDFQDTEPCWQCHNEFVRTIK